MGRPSSSCLKIIACGSDSSVEDGNTESSEAKGSGEKCSWIFRKRSAKHRVLSNDISSKNLNVGAAKETPQSTSIGSETPTLPTISEKVLALEQPNEKHQTPASFELKPSKSIELEPSEALDAPKQPEPLGSDVLERVDASKALEIVEPEVRISMGEPETLDPVEPEVPVIDVTFAVEKPESVEPNISVSEGESESLNLIESEVPEIEATFALEPPELVEPTIQHVSVAESESLNLNDPEVPETLTASSLEPPEQVEMKTCEGDVVPKPHVSAELKPSETLVSLQDDNLEEPLIITIQAGVRGFLAQRQLVKLRSTIKLQAAIRGHLVRRQAVDTLYCMQGIIKVQNLVRAHSSQANGVFVTKQITTKSPTEKLLKNAFARQLIDSTPKSKSTIIKCDPLMPNYAWTWLERWMNVSSSELSYSETPEIMEEGEQSQGEKISPIIECEDLSQVKLDSINPEITVEEASKTFEFEKGSIISDPTEDYQPSNLQSSEEKMEQTHDSTDASFEESLGMVAQNLSTQSDSHSQPQSGSLSNNLIVETNEPNLSTKRMMAFEQVDVENKKLAYGSRKASNPAFILAQSKFEVLSSAASNCASSLEESVHKEEDPISSEALKPDETKFNIGGSECGTQLSVTSTLDSPDQSGAEVVEMEVKLKSLEEGSNNLINDEDLEVTTNGHSSVYVPNLSPSTLSQKEIPESNGVPKSEAIAYDEHDDGEYVVLNMAQDSTKVEQKPERSASDLHEEAGSQIEQPTSDVPLEATPNNDHLAIAESQGTPSKHVSVKIKKNKVEKSGSDKKHGSHSTSKRTIIKALQNSGVRSSGEKLPKDQKSAKRRNSLGSTKYDHIDQEPQSNTSSSKTLPSYMQATQSAKAKAHSPRSSSDVQDKDTNLIKKRHSLAGAGGRHGSPCVQQPPTCQSPQSQVVCLGNV